MTPEQIKAYYNVIVNRKFDDAHLSERADIIRLIEKETGLEFKNTDDFKSKVDAFLARSSDTAGIKLREERQRRGWSVETLAKILTVSPRHLIRMEDGRSGLCRSAFGFLHGDMSEKTKSRIQRLGSVELHEDGIPATTLPGGNEI